MKQFIKTPQNKDEKNQAIRTLNEYNDTFDPDTKGFDFNQSRFEKLKEYYKKYGVDFPEVPEEFYDPVSLEVMNIPVKITTVFENNVKDAKGKDKTERTEHDHFFDFSTLVNYYKANKRMNDRNRRFIEHPLNRLPVQTSSLQPAQKLQDKIHEFIMKAKEDLKKEIKAQKSKQEYNQLKVSQELSETRILTPQANGTKKRELPRIPAADSETQSLANNPGQEEDTTSLCQRARSNGTTRRKQSRA